MSDVQSDLDAGQEMAAEAACELHKLNPNHELLDLFKKGGGTVSDEEYDKVWESFQVRFGRSDVTKEQRGTAPGQAHFWAGYMLALEAEVKKLSPPRAVPA